MCFWFCRKNKKSRCQYCKYLYLFETDYEYHLKYFHSDIITETTNLLLISE